MTRNRRPAPAHPPRSARSRPGPQRPTRLAAASLAALALAWGAPPALPLISQGEARAQGAGAQPAASSGPYAPAPKDQPKDADGLPAVPTIQGHIDVDELRRLLEVAKESGLTEEQLHDITVEDENGHVVNAWDYLAAYDRRKKAEEERLAAERAKVYLTPNDILKELDKKQPKDLEELRDKLIFVD